MGICCMTQGTQCLCSKLEGWYEEGDGREVPEGGEICIPMTDSWIHVDVWQKPTKFCKAVIFQLKNQSIKISHIISV